jgi:phenylpropionate dioxygenase-like ring-hydroxylating dioxygenase large terminal subunit
MKEATLKTVGKAVEFEMQRRNTPPEGFPALPEVPGGRYTRQDFYDLEKQAVWPKSWICAGLETSVGKPGDYQAFDKLGVPIVLVRGQDNQVRAFYNTCRHRGARLTSEDSGCTKLLRCQYHSWAYDLAGKLVAVPDERDFSCLDKSARGLIGLRCEVWNGLVFVTENQDAPPVDEWLGGLVSDFETIDIKSLRVVQHDTRRLKCNWKAGVDAFLESYHVRTVHKQTVSLMLDVDGSVMTLFDNGHSRMFMPRNQGDNEARKNVNLAAHDAAPDIAEMHQTFRANSIVYHLFPNMIIPVDKFGFPIMQFWPRGKDECEMEMYFLGPDWGDAERPPVWDTYMQIVDQIMDEDLRNLESIQASLNSGAFTGMMLNYQERRIYWFHEELDRYIGNDQLPPELAVSQVLKDHMTTPFDMVGSN